MATENAERLQARAIRETGGSTVNTIFEVGFEYGTEGGTFTIEMGGNTTLPIAFPLGASAFKAAMEGLPSVGSGGLNVLSGPRGGPFRCELVGDNAGQAVEPPFFDGTDLDPTQEVECELIIAGGTTDYSTDAADAWADYSDAKTENERFLRTKIALINLRLGKLTDAVDTATGSHNRLERKDSQQVTNLEKMLGRVEGALNQELSRQGSGRRRTFGGIMKAGENPYGRYK